MTIRPWCRVRSSSTAAAARIDLLARRHQHGAVLEPPAVILHMRDFDAACAERERQIDHVGDVIDIGAVHHGVDGERQFAPHHLGGERALACECAAHSRRYGRRIARRCPGSRPARDRGRHRTAGQRLVGDADGRGDQIGVEPGVVRGRGEFDEVAPRTRLAAREMHLQHAERRRFVEDARPGRGIEFVRARIERDRIGAIRAAERATVRQLGQEAERLVQRYRAGCHAAVIPLSFLR